MPSPAGPDVEGRFDEFQIGETRLTVVAAYHVDPAYSSLSLIGAAAIMRSARSVSASLRAHTFSPGARRR